MKFGTSSFWSEPVMSARRSSARAWTATCSGVGLLNRFRMSRSPTSAHHEIGQRAAQRLRMVRRLPGFLCELEKPFAGIDTFGRKRDAPHHHANGGLQPAAVDLEIVAALA